MTTWTLSHNHRASSIVTRVAELLFRDHPRRQRYLDVRDLPDHLKRDLGFLDGIRPSGSVPLGRRRLPGISGGRAVKSPSPHR